MKILFLSQRFLMPMDTGGKIRTGNILQELRRKHEITVISNVEQSKDAEFISQMDRFCDKFIGVDWKEPNRYTLKFFVRLFFQMFSPHPVSVLNTLSKNLERALLDESGKNDYDVIVCDFVQAAQMLRRLDYQQAVLFQHNVESIIAKRHVEQAGNWLTKLFWWLQWRKMHRYEHIQSRKFHRVIAVSESDAMDFAELYKLDNVRTIPTGVDVDFFQPQSEASIAENRIAFCGSMDWLPNEDGILYFLREILPLVKSSRPQAELVVIGRKPTTKLKQACEQISNVTLTGWVDDTRPHLLSSALVIVPLRIGGGTRMKIFEAMALGKAVVSTSIGAEGLPVQHEQNILIADQPDQFAATIVDLLNRPDRATEVGREARTYVTENFAWPQVSAVFESICFETANQHSSSVAAEI